MDMHDKDIDQLFRSKLGDIEAEPSAKVWKGIAAGLNAPAAKKSIVPYLRIAASVIIVLGAGLWLMLNQQSGRGQKIKPTKMLVKQRQPQVAKDDRLNQPDVQEEHHTIIKDEPKQAASINQVAALHQTATQTVNTHESADNAVQIANQSNGQAAQQQLAAVTTPAQTTVEPVVPDAIMPEKNALADEGAFKPTANNTAANVVAAADLDKPKHRKHGIHSLGDVVNIVVARVDKRQDKLIEFTDTDDDEAEVTGINLGIFRVKKQK